jgi:hypothetical protein
VEVALVMGMPNNVYQLTEHYLIKIWFMETVIANISQQEEIVRDVWMGTMMNLGDLHTRTSSTFAENANVMVTPRNVILTLPSTIRLVTLVVVFAMIVNIIQLVDNVNNVNLFIIETHTETSQTPKCVNHVIVILPDHSAEANAKL